MPLNLITKRIGTIALPAVCLAIIMASTAIAKPGDGGKGGHPGGPPPEALEACADKSEIEACSFITPRGHEINGTCIIPPHNEAELICAPEGGPPEHPRPPEKHEE
ncbi:MAG: hypothetical protein V3U84_08135 [Thiotrichaceae bacterium]